MAGINTGKVITGGVVAGVVFLVADLAISMFLLQADMEAAMQARNLDPAAMQSTAGMVSWVVSDLLFGILAVWVYAAIRPRFGPGAKTAVYAGLTVFAVSALMMIGMTTMGMFSAALTLKMGLVWLIVTPIGTVAGAKFYSEG